MEYLLQYIEHRRLHGAPRFKIVALRSFYLKVFLLSLFLPFDLLYLLLTRERRRHLFDVVVFSEKYKRLSAKLNGNVALITVPSLSLIFGSRSNVYYFPASVFFIGVFVSLCIRRLFIINLLRIRCNKFVLHTDGLLVPRYLLKCLCFNKSICIQHGEYRKLDDIYDGMLCDENIVFGSDQAELFRTKGYLGFVYSGPDLDTSYHFKLDQMDFSFDQIVLVGQGYHVNDAKMHTMYQNQLYKIYQKLKRRGFSVAYRPHPSEIFFHYRRFYFSRERVRSSLHVNLGRLYVGSESTLLRKVKELGGNSCLVDELHEANLDLLKDSFCHVGLGLPDTLLDKPFTSFAIDVINGTNR